MNKVCNYLGSKYPKKWYLNVGLGRQDKGFAFFDAKRSFGLDEYEAGNPPSTIDHAKRFNL